MKSPPADDLEDPRLLVSENVKDPQSDDQHHEPSPDCTRRLFSDAGTEETLPSSYAATSEIINKDHFVSSSGDPQSDAISVTEDNTLINYLEQNHPGYILHSYSLLVLAQKEINEEFLQCQLVVLLNVRETFLFELPL